MSRLARDERGLTLVELMVVAVMTIVVLGATLDTFTSFERTTGRNERQNDSQQQVRRALDTVSRELRNLASPTDELPQAIGRAMGGDLIFQSIGRSKPAGSANARNAQRVRYCLDADGRKLWRQEQTWTTAIAPAMPSATQCPAAPASGGWNTRVVAAENVVNGDRPVFDYNAAQATAITEIRLRLFVDATPGRRPGEATLETGVFLRNQNRAPVARFTAAVNAGSVVLNASGSEDPEEKAMDFYWYDQGVTSGACGTLPPEVPQAGCVGKGIVFSYSPPAVGTRAVYLVARDPAGLTDAAPAQSVCLTGPGTVCQ